MSSITHEATRPAGTARALAAGAGALVAGVAAFASATPLGPVFAGTAVAAYGIVAGLVAATVARTHDAPVFGLPNAVTLARGVATALVAGYVAEVLAGWRPADALAVVFAALAVAAILADGLDGRLARTRGPATAFGARFDMETDAALILALSVLAFGLGKAGAWVILIGAMRYAFVAAGAVLPWLEAPLPPSLRRKAVCVVQGAALAALALPQVTGAPATWLAGVALAALAWSFAVDVRWLAAARRS
jgi:phosphatidylglycerophosphate synthase